MSDQPSPSRDRYFSTSIINQVRERQTKGFLENSGFLRLNHVDRDQTCPRLDNFEPQNIKNSLDETQALHELFNVIQKTFELPVLNRFTKTGKFKSRENLTKLCRRAGLTFSAAVEIRCLINSLADTVSEHPPATRAFFPPNKADLFPETGAVFIVDEYTDFIFYDPALYGVKRSKRGTQFHYSFKHRPINGCVSRRYENKSIFVKRISFNKHAAQAWNDKILQTLETVVPLARQNTDLVSTLIRLQRQPFSRVQRNSKLNSAGQQQLLKKISKFRTAFLKIVLRKRIQLIRQETH